ncbi:DUF4286 family protein [Cupriavidus pauculus]|uniref:DUF4286 family protein n=1 Tax=Cupriavidus pauculus TaxID=82633 RepID=UPI001EE358EA|nr:DUF4286 family protein [Cupriavidus pauculus]GJG97702.1 hypothetical protein CBA19C6_24455 [Cupriavidus pauculus]
MSENKFGMLFVASDIGADDEHDFNAWYDREHIEERVRMNGVISAARYVAISGRPKYLGLYWAESISVFASPAYAHAFRHQTPWSVSVLPKIQNPTRRIGEVSADVGQGSGGWVAVLPLNADTPAFEQKCANVGALLATDIGFVRSYVITTNDELSRPLPQEDLSKREMRPLFVIESSNSASNEAALRHAIEALPCAPADAARYQLTWKLSREELK